MVSESPTPPSYGKLTKIPAFVLVKNEKSYFDGNLLIPFDFFCNVHWRYLLNLFLKVISGNMPHPTSRRSDFFLPWHSFWFFLPNALPTLVCYYPKMSKISILSQILPIKQDTFFLFCALKVNFPSYCVYHLGCYSWLLCSIKHCVFKIIALNKSLKNVHL